MAAVGHLRVNHLLHSPHILDYRHGPGEIGLLPRRPENKRPHHLQERPAHLHGTGHRPGFEQRQPLPDLTARGVVLLVVVERARQLTHRPFGTQAQVHPKDIAFPGLFGQRLRQLPGENFEVFLIRDAGCSRPARPPASWRAGFPLVRLVDVNQVHIGAVIELMAAELAHPHHGKSGFHPPPLPVFVHGHAVLLPQVGIDNLVGGMNQDAREIRQQRRGVRYRRQPQEIAHADAQHLPPAEPAQHLQLQLFDRQMPEVLAKRLLDAFPRRGLRKHSLLRQPIDQHRVANDGKGQRIAVTEDGTEQVKHARRAVQIVEKGGAGYPRQQALPMIERLIGISRPGDRIHQDRENVCKLAALVGIACHRLKITVGLFDVAEVVGRHNGPHLFRAALGREQNRPGIRFCGRERSLHLICSRKRWRRSSRHRAALYWPHRLRTMNPPLIYTGAFELAALSNQPSAISFGSRENLMAEC